MTPIRGYILKIMLYITAVSLTLTVLYQVVPKYKSVPKAESDLKIVNTEYPIFNNHIPIDICQNLNTIINFTDFVDGKNETGYPCDVVPNYAHFIHMTNDPKPDITFITVICIRAVFFNHHPAKIMIHSNITGKLSGKYWDMVKDIPNLEVKYADSPTHIFGVKFGFVQHASDIIRTKILMKYGGIYLDTDSYVVKSLNRYLKYEYTLGWPAGAYMGTQILIAHRNARFLKMYYDSYKHYEPKKWYYNAGELPTTAYLHRNPSLVHRETKNLFVEFNDNMANILYNKKKSQRWKEFDAIHVSIRHRKFMEKKFKIKDLNEENIKTYDRPFGEMARLVVYGQSGFVMEKNATLRKLL